jgi:hypothetical protein
VAGSRGPGAGGRAGGGQAAGRSIDDHEGRERGRGESFSLFCSLSLARSLSCLHTLLLSLEVWIEAYSRPSNKTEQTVWVALVGSSRHVRIAAFRRT